MEHDYEMWIDRKLAFMPSLREGMYPDLPSVPMLHSARKKLLCLS